MDKKPLEVVFPRTIDSAIIWQFIRDAHQYFLKSIESNALHGHAEDVALQDIFNQCDNILSFLNEENKLEPIIDINPSTYDHQQTTAIQHITTKNEVDELEDNSSYLDMSVRKYESYDLIKTKDFNPNEYVDVVGKTKKRPSHYHKDDDNIYDNYIIGSKSETSTSKPSNEIRATVFSAKTCVKRECPFAGLPAAHLTIMQSPKIGWLTLYQRRRRFLPNFGIHLKRKYYAGLVRNKIKSDNEDWWLLLYVGGSNDLKPTICIQVNQFEISRDNRAQSHTKKTKIPKRPKTKEAKSNIDHENKQTTFKFDMKEKKSTKSDLVLYCFSSTSVVEGEQWFCVLQQLSKGQQICELENIRTAQIRRLPLLPVTSSSKGAHDEPDTAAELKKDLQNSLVYTNQDLCNYSEGVYEEPEEFYKILSYAGVSSIPSPSPNLPAKISNQIRHVETDEISIYDTPKSPARPVIADPIEETPDLPSKSIEHVDRKTIPTKDNLVEDGIDSIGIDVPIERNTMNITEIRLKLTTQLKEHSHKYLSTDHNATDCTGAKAENLSAGIANNSSSTANSQKSQLSTVRKWLFTNHLARIKQSSTSSRKSSAQNSSEATTTSTILQKPRSIYSVQPKGNKVHMIINQLEANGQLTLLGGGACK